MKKTLLKIFLAMALLTADNASACRCVVDPDQEAQLKRDIKRSDVIVLATAEFEAPEGKSRLWPKSMVLNVVEPILPNTVQQTLKIEKELLTSCDFAPTRDIETLYFLSYRADGSLEWPNKCVGSKPMNDPEAKDYLRRVRNLARESP